MLNELRRSQTIFSSICAWTDNGLTNFEASGGNYLGGVNYALGDYFTTLGVRPELGRLIGRADAPSAPRLPHKERYLTIVHGRSGIGVTRM